MGLNFHPQTGTILVCDFGMLRTPEITKRRPVIVISPNLKHRDNLCTIVPLSKSAPNQIMAFHHKIFWEPLLPEPYTNPSSWVLGDMVYTISFERLKLLQIGKDANGKRIYDQRVLEEEDMKAVRKAVLCGIGLEPLTRHL